MPVGFKKHSYPCAWILPVVLIVVLLTGCKKNTGAGFDGNASLMAAGFSSNLVKNPSFSEKDAKDQLPLDWKFNFEYNDLSGLKTNPGGLAWERNSQGKFLVFQNIPVTKNRFYKVVMQAKYTVNDFSPFGIYVTDGLTGSLLGKLEKVNIAAADSLQLMIYSANLSWLKLQFGFPANMNANIEVSNVSVHETTYDPAPMAHPLADLLIQQLELFFTRQEFDNSIRKLCDYVNQMLICANQNIQCEDYILQTRNLIAADSSFQFSIRNFQRTSEIDQAYCQRSSLTLDEVLNNAFHIPVRQVHLMFGDIGKHQFIEYWNPFAGKWIAIDPYFSGQFSRKGQLIGANEVDFSQPGLSFQRFGRFVFEPRLEELEKLWSEKNSVRVDAAYYISYPFN